MTPRELRAAADCLDKLCMEGSRGKRTMPCPTCKFHSDKLRQFAEDLDPRSKLHTLVHPATVSHEESESAVDVV